MANYLYNGVELPELPKWDKKQYPYALIDNPSHILIIGESVKYTNTSSGYTVYFSGDCLNYMLDEAGDKWIIRPGDGTVLGNAIKNIIWSNTDILNEDGSVYLSASEPVPTYVIIPAPDYEAACDAIRAKTGKTDLIKSGDLAVEIGSIITGSIGGEGVEFILSATNWNGTTYSLDTTGYTISYAPQLGLPIVSDYSNTRAVVTSALTIPEASGTTVIISSVKAPTTDVKVAIFGLTVDTTTEES